MQDEAFLNPCPLAWFQRALMMRQCGARLRCSPYRASGGPLEASIGDDRALRTCLVASHAIERCAADRVLGRSR